MGRYLWNLHRGILQCEDGILDAETLDIIGSQMMMSVLMPGGAEWYKHTLNASPQVRRYIEERMNDPDRSSRWRDQRRLVVVICLPRVYFGRLLGSLKQSRFAAQRSGCLVPFPDIHEYGGDFPQRRNSIRCTKMNCCLWHLLQS